MFNTGAAFLPDGDWDDSRLYCGHDTGEPADGRRTTTPALSFPKDGGSAVNSYYPGSSSSSSSAAAPQQQPRRAPLSASEQRSNNPLAPLFGADPCLTRADALRAMTALPGRSQTNHLAKEYRRKANRRSRGRGTLRISSGGNNNNSNSNNAMTARSGGGGRLRSSGQFTGGQGEGDETDDETDEDEEGEEDEEDEDEDERTLARREKARIVRNWTVPGLSELLVPTPHPTVTQCEAHRRYKSMLNFGDFASLPGL